MSWILTFELVAFAHDLDGSTLYLSVRDDGLHARVEVECADLERAIPLDHNRDGRVDARELDVAREPIQALMRRALQVEHDGSLAFPMVRSVASREQTIHIELDFPEVDHPPEGVDLRYRFLWDGLLPSHTALVLIEENVRTGLPSGSRQIVGHLGPGRERRHVDFRVPPRAELFGTFVEHGVWHIWAGLDHVLFIVALLLPAVLERRHGRWVPAASFETSLWRLLRGITSFTLAHSITLGLAIFGVIQLPAVLVETLIAVSIGAVALNNLRPVLDAHAGWLIFGFGLFHGLGFAAVMEPLGLMRSALLTSLVGFNVGVELGQIAIVAVVFPLLFHFRDHPAYARWVLGGGSGLLVVASSYWVVERAVVPAFAG